MQPLSWCFTLTKERIRVKDSIQGCFLAQLSIPLHEPKLDPFSAFLVLWLEDLRSWTVIRGAAKSHLELDHWTVLLLRSQIGLQADFWKLDTAIGGLETVLHKEDHDWLDHFEPAHWDFVGCQDLKGCLDHSLHAECTECHTNLHKWSNVECC